MILETAENIAQEFGLRNGSEIGSQLAAAYSSPERAYHNCTHIENMLEVINTQRARCHYWNELVWAILFHDAVHDSRAKDNEERSVDLAIECLRGNVNAGTEVVRGLIMSTKSHVPFDDSFDAKLMLDADLAILGSNAESYQAYAIAIRQEYSWVPDADYQQGRTRVLREF